MEELKNLEEKEIFKDKDFISAVKYVIKSNNASTAAIQRKFMWGYAKAARYLDLMQMFGYVKSAGAGLSRKVCVSLDVFKKDAGANFDD